MSEKLPIIVKFEVIESQINLFENEVVKILKSTREEQGCILYELHQDLENPYVFMFYEIWETTEAWEKHDTMPYIEAFKKIIPKTVKNLSFNKLKIL